MIDEIKTFEQRKNELVKKGKEKGYITYEELAASLKGLDLDADSLDDLYNAFNENNIAVVSEADQGRRPLSEVWRSHQDGSRYRSWSGIQAGYQVLRIHARLLQG